MADRSQRGVVLGRGWLWSSQRGVKQRLGREAEQLCSSEKRWFGLRVVADLWMGESGDVVVLPEEQIRAYCWGVSTQQEAYHFGLGILKVLLGFLSEEVLQRPSGQAVSCSSLA